MTNCDVSKNNIISSMLSSDDNISFTNEDTMNSSGEKNYQNEEYLDEMTQNVYKIPNISEVNKRILDIKTLLSGNKLNPMVKFDSHETEDYVSVNEDDSENIQIDIRDERIIGKKILDIQEIISTLGVKLSYIKSGTTGHTFQGVSNTGDEIFALKMVAYKNRSEYGTMYDVLRPENVELLMIKALSYFVVREHTPHIVLPIATFNTSIKPFVNRIKEITDNKRYLEFIEKYEKKQFSPLCSILISEWANGGDLLDYFRKNYKTITLEEWRVMFFQIISVLSVIQTKYPSFRHNDLKANNILVNYTETRKDYQKNNHKKQYKYEINNYNFIIPDIGIQIKLWDFDFACIPGIIDNAKVNADWANKMINVKPKKNQYYDMHFFFNTLIRKEFFPQLLSDNSIPQKVKDFVNRIVPDKYKYGKYTTEKGRILIDKELFIPFQVLIKDPFFKKYRVYR